MTNILTTLKTNLPIFAKVLLKIRTKQGKVESFNLNSAQQEVHRRIQAQLASKGKVRVIILKGRQQGISTYVSGRIFHKVMFNEGQKAFVLTHVSNSTNALFDMIKRFYEFLLDDLKPSISRNNANETVFDKLNSSIKVSTAGSAGTGRGETIQAFFGSEVAFWPNEDEILTGAMQAVPDMPGSEIILESTANGARGLFHKMAMQAQQNIGDYELIFIPWFLQTEYRRPVENRTFSQAELNYGKQYNLSLEQLAWRQNKITELGFAKFRQEYPATPEEAFQADVVGALWTNATIERARKTNLPEGVKLVRITIGVDPAVTSNPNSDETGIVVVGLGDDSNLYVLDDLSGKYTAEQWARKVIQAYHEWDAGTIIVETNQGGDLVKNSIRAVDPTANVLGKHVSVSKQQRHDPVAALYSRGVVYHIGVMPDLERQMVTWSPLDKKVSPDRVDALVLAVAELGLKNKRQTLDAAVF